MISCEMHSNCNQNKKLNKMIIINEHEVKKRNFHFEQINKLKIKNLP